MGYTSTDQGQTITTPDGRTLTADDGSAYRNAYLAWYQQENAPGSSSSKKDPKVFMGSTPGRMPAWEGLFSGHEQGPELRPSPPGVSTKTILGPDGDKIVIPMGGGPGRTRGTKPTDNIQTQSAALNAPLSWSKSRIEKAIKQAQALGYKVETFNDFLSVWQDAVKQSAAAFNNGSGKKISPWDMMGLLAIGSKPYKATQATQPFTGTKVTTSSNTSVDDVDPGTAAAIIDSSLSQYLGRAASDTEKADFLSRATGLARANPTVTKQVTSTDYQNGRAVNQDTTSSQSGGVTSDDLAEAAKEQAQASPDYGAYQAAGTIYGWLQSALGAAA